MRQFPRPAFDWRHLPIYRMNQKRLLLTTLFSGGGFGLALGAVTELEDQPSRATAMGIGVWSAMTALGYLWGRKKDRKNVTLEIQQPDASGGP